MVTIKGKLTNWITWKQRTFIKGIKGSEKASQRVRDDNHNTCLEKGFRYKNAYKTTNQSGEDFAEHKRAKVLKRISQETANGQKSSI